MSLSASVSLFGLDLEDPDLLMLILGQDIGFHLGAQKRSPYLDVLVVLAEEENLVKNELLAGLSIEFLDFDFIALFDEVLLGSSKDNGEHKVFFKSSENIGGNEGICKENSQ